MSNGVQYKHKFKYKIDTYPQRLRRKLMFTYEEMNLPNKLANS